MFEQHVVTTTQASQTTSNEHSTMAQAGTFPNQEKLFRQHTRYLLFSRLASGLQTGFESYSPFYQTLYQ